MTAYPAALMTRPMLTARLFPSRSVNRPVEKAPVNSATPMSEASPAMPASAIRERVLEPGPEHDRGELATGGEQRRNRQHPDRGPAEREATTFRHVGMVLGEQDHRRHQRNADDDGDHAVGSLPPALRDDPSDDRSPDEETAGPGGLERGEPSGTRLRTARDRTDTPGRTRRRRPCRGPSGRSPPAHPRRRPRRR